MVRWTIIEPSDGRYRRYITHGGTPYWCMFDFVVQPAPECKGVEIALTSDADPVSAEWFPHLHKGMLRGIEAETVRGREWVAMRVEVRKVHAHPIDTSASGCERYGFSFVLDELPRFGVSVLENFRDGAHSGF